MFLRCPRTVKTFLSQSADKVDLSTIQIQMYDISFFHAHLSPQFQTRKGVCFLKTRKAAYSKNHVWLHSPLSYAPRSLVTIPPGPAITVWPVKETPLTSFRPVFRTISLLFSTKRCDYNNLRCNAYLIR